MARGMVGEAHAARKESDTNLIRRRRTRFASFDLLPRCRETPESGSAAPNLVQPNYSALRESNLGMRVLVAILLALTLPAAAAAKPRTVKPDRAAIDRLLDEFIPAAVAQKNLQRGWELSAGPARTVSHPEWMKGNTSIQKYPAKGPKFRGWTVNYSYPGDIGFDILLQPSTASLGAWSFRAEAQKIHGRWKITTWYPVATFAPPGRTQTVLGPNDLGAADSASAGSGSDHGR